MTLNGDILYTTHCKHYVKLGRGHALSNASVITYDVRDVGQHIVKREMTDKVRMNCHLSSIQQRDGGIVLQALELF